MKGEASWYLGVDLGTSSCKALVIDAAGRPLGLGQGAYPASGVEARFHEQDPLSLLTGLVAAVRAAVAHSGRLARDCAGLSLGGALHSLMALDRNGRPLTGVITWADNRAAPQAQTVKASSQSAQLYQQTGCPVHAMYPLYKLLWLRQERPQVFARAAHFVSAKEYVLAQLTGRYAVDYNLAAGAGLLNTYTLDWNPDSLALTGISREQLSPLASPLQVLGELLPEWSAETGLPVGVPVVLGSSDAANSSLGAGAVRPDQATCMIGTSGALRVFAQRPILDESGRMWCYAVDPQHWLVGGAINNGGLALTWLRDMLNSARKQLSAETGSANEPDHRLPIAAFLSFSDVLDLAQAAPPGAGGLLCLPFFAGERSPNWNQDARAVFFGMTIEHDARHLARALLEGVAFRFRSLFAMFEEAGLQPAHVHASGGFTQSAFWLLLMSSVLGRELALPAWGETSALGAALWALWAGGGADSFEALGQLAPLEGQVAPDPQAAAVYQRLWPLHRDLYNSLNEHFSRIAAVQHDLRSTD